MAKGPPRLDNARWPQVGPEYHVWIDHNLFNQTRLSLNQNSKLVATTAPSEKCQLWQRWTPCGERVAQRGALYP